MTENTFYEFFAGGGMARAGLGPGWRCTFANDIDPMKAAAYAANFGAEHLVCADVAALEVSMLPGCADLAWASFPCQDLSLAGGRLGMGAGARTRSGTFWPFWSLMEDLRREGRAPRAIVLENVPGILTSHSGRDFAAVGEALSSAGYRFGALVLDAVRFVPQSRPRVFFVAVEDRVIPPAGLTAAEPSSDWHPPALVAAWRGLSEPVRKSWLWLCPPLPPPRTTTLADLLEDDPGGWHTPLQTERLLNLMSPLHRAKVDSARALGATVVGCVYRRTRPALDGTCRQRAEIRFDGIAGCLRTPAGGSSRQTLLVVAPSGVRSRLLSPRETARLMGLDDSYILPDRCNDGYRVTGDGVCAHAARFAARRMIEPALTARPADLLAAE